ncbi:MAG TPA: AMP-binding protein [Rhizobiaceae bacterium]|nr:AMP-binding protein [Rhizobiaceae bacterium]
MDFRQAREFLLGNREDYEAARAGFRWPDPSPFNWALDWFDAGLAAEPQSRDRPALWVHDVPTGSDVKLTFGELSRRSNQVANYLRLLGLKRGDHLLLLLGNVPALWETTLAAMKLGVVVIPATTLLTPDELADRVERGHARAILADPEQLRKCEGIGRSDVVRITTGPASEDGWRLYSDAFSQPELFTPDGPTEADDPLLLYFTSGTTAKPKLVRHSHRSYPVGALSTMYWLGLKPGDVHLNVSSPGWAKHAWSSLFAPWNAGATVLVVNQTAFSAKALLSALVRCGVTTLCAPPTVWRLLIQEDLSAYRVVLREVCGAGEPLNPEVIETVRKAWGKTIRDGYGQTETTAQVANTPGQKVKPGAMGRVLPGYEIRLLDAEGNPAKEGEVCILLGENRPAGLMQGYQDGDGSLKGADGALYRTGDVAFTDDDGYLTFVGRADDVFKSSDYRISPFELESVLIEHEAVVEAAIVPAPDPIRLSIPKAYVTLAGSAKPDRDTALSIFRFTGERLAPFKRIRRIEFVTELPKTISGKIRRVHLRRLEHETSDDPFRGVAFDEADFAELSERKRPS